MKKERGITLIALVVTIIILLILAGITMTMVLGENGLFRRAQDAKNRTQQAERSESSIMDDWVASLDSEIVKSGDKIDVKEIEDIDGSVSLPTKKTDDELIRLGYIPIYTTEQFKQIAADTQQYQINDLQGKDKGKYNMNKNAKYAIINDIDFSDVTGFHGIAEFRGELEGNGCILSNLNINNMGEYEGDIPLKIFQNDNMKYNKNAGIISSADGATIQNLEIDNSIFMSPDSSGAIVGKCDNTTIDNCYAKGCTFGANFNAGGIVGAVWTNKSKITNCKTIDIAGERKYGGIVGDVFGDIEIDGCQTYMSENKTNNNCGGIIKQIDSNQSFSKSENKNITVKNCKVQNLMLTSQWENGAGIIGGAYNSSSNLFTNVYIYNCSAKNLSGNYDAGVIGCINEGNFVKIEKCSVQNMTKSISGYSITGGIVGTASNPKSLEINECTGKNINYKNSNQSKYLSATTAGIIGFARMEEGTLNVRKCAVTEMNIDIPYSNDESYVYGAGIIGCISVPNANIEKCLTANINIKAGGQNAGIIAIGICRGGSINATDCISRNIEITANPKDSGGIFCVLEANDVQIENCNNYNSKFNGKECAGGIIATCNVNNEFKLSNCNTINSNFNVISQNAGGLVGIVHSPKVEIKDSNANTIKIVNSYDSRNNSGGIVGAVNSRGASVLCLIDNCKLNNGEITGDNVGGILGLSMIPTSITNCKASDCNIEVNNAEAMAGGIASYAYKTVDFQNNEAKNINIKGKANIIGGVLGAIYLNSGNENLKDCIAEGITIDVMQDEKDHDLMIGGIISNGNIMVDSCSAKNISINGSKESLYGRAAMFGGIAGVYRGKEIKNCNVESINIKNNWKDVLSSNLGGIAGVVSDNGNIISCNVNKTTIENAGHTGGITGYIGYDGIIENCVVSESTIKNAENIGQYMNMSSHYVGGIAGIATSLKNNKVVKCNIIGEGLTAGVGGVLGHGNNSYKESKVLQCSVEDSEILGQYEVGGISGATAPIVTDCSVSNSTIKGTQKYAGGIIGFGGILQDNSYFPLTLTNNHVNNCRIYGNEYFNEIVGKNSGNSSNSNVTQDKISGCDAPGTTKTSI